MVLLIGLSFMITVGLLVAGLGMATRGARWTARTSGRG